MATIGSLNILLSTSTAQFSSGMRTAEGALRRFTGAVTSSRGLLTGLGLSLGAAGIAIGIKKIITTGAGFEHQMKAVKAVSGATAEELDMLSAKAKQLGKGFFSATQAAEGMEILAQAGFDTATILKTTGPTLALAAAGSIELSQAADVASSTMRGMGIAADDLQRVVDVLAKASSASNADVGGLGEALKTAGPLAHAAGKSIEETVSAIEAFSNAGIKGEEAGVAMRQILIRMANQTPEATKALKQLGIKMTDTAGELRPVADVVDDFNAKMAGMGSGKKLDMLSNIFDARGAAHFAALLGQGGQALRDFEADLKNSTGAAAEQAAIRMDSLTGDWTKFTNAVGALSTTITEGTSGGLRSIVQFATSAVNWIDSMWTSVSQTFNAGLQSVWQMSATIWGSVREVTADLLGTTAEGVGTSMQSISELVVVGLATCEFAFVHWKDVATIAFLNVALGAISFGNQVAYVFTEVIPKTLDWLLNNWKDIFFTLADFTMTVFINLGQNIQNAIRGIWDYITSGGASGFDVEKMWTPLTQGFVNSIRKLPEIANRELSATELGLSAAIALKEKQLNDNFGDFVGQRLTEFRDRMTAAGKEHDAKAPAGPNLNLPDNKTPAGIGESKKNAALELGTAAAFHASFGGKSDSRTWQQMLKEAQKSARDIERIRLQQEKNNVQPAGIEF